MEAEQGNPMGGKVHPGQAKESDKTTKLGTSVSVRLA